MMTNEKTMTARDFYTAVIDVLSAHDMREDLVAYAEGAIAQLDATNAKRKEKTDKASREKAAADAPLMDALQAALTNEPKTATDLKDVIEANVQKTSSLLRALVKAGRANVQDVKVKGKGTQKGYTAI